MRKSACESGVSEAEFENSEWPRLQSASSKCDSYCRVACWFGEQSDCYSCAAAAAGNCYPVCVQVLRSSGSSWVGWGDLILNELRNLELLIIFLNILCLFVAFVMNVKKKRY